MNKRSPSGPTMIFMPGHQEVVLKKEATILDLALSSGITLHHSCGGMGCCTTCRVVVEEGLEKLEERNHLENEIATERGFADHERLACQTLAVPGLRVRIPYPLEGDGEI